jgi:hypothetical protein
MEQENYRDRQVRDKTRQVVDYHYDEAKPGKPLHLLVPGGLIALAALGLIVLIVYRVWFEGTLDQGTGVPLLGLLAPIYVGGVFLFSYGYEIYNLPRALRLTAIIVFVTLAAVVIVAVLFVLLGGASKSGSSSSKSSRSRSSSGKNAKASVSPSRRTWNSGPGMGPIFFGGGSGTRTVTREVVREVPVEPPAPEPVTCPNCGRSYLAAENEFVCPGCGAPAPVEPPA